MRLAAVEEMMRSLDERATSRCCGSASASRRDSRRASRKSRRAWRSPRSTAPMRRHVSPPSATLGGRLRPGRAEPAGGAAREISRRHASSRPTSASGRPPPPRCSGIDRAAHLLFGHRDAVLRTEPRIGAGADRHRTGDHVRRHGRHQHGARRADDARRLHDLRRAAGDAEAHRRSRFWWRFPRRFSSPGSRASCIERTIIRFLYGRPLETLLATFGVSLILQQLVRSIFSAQQPIGDDAGVDERHAAAERGAVDHLQPPLHRDLHADRVRDPARWC